MSPYLTSRTVGDTLPLLHDLQGVLVGAAFVLIVTLGIVLAAAVAREDR